MRGRFGHVVVAKTIDGQPVWHAGNDGAGSGLHADLLDGQQGSHYLDYRQFSNTPGGVVQVTGNKTLALGDAWTVQRVTAAAIITVPANVLTVNDRVEILSDTTGSVSLSFDSGVTFTSFENLAQLAGKGAGAVLIQVALNHWVLSGRLV